MMGYWAHVEDCDTENCSCNPVWRWVNAPTSTPPGQDNTSVSIE